MPTRILHLAVQPRLRRQKQPDTASAAGWFARWGQDGGYEGAGYNWRALMEADVSRWKRVIGDGLRSRTDGRQATEVAIAADVLNRMLEFGRPEYVRVA